MPPGDGSRAGADIVTSSGIEKTSGCGMRVHVPSSGHSGIEYHRRRIALRRARHAPDGRLTSSRQELEVSSARSPRCERP